MIGNQLSITVSRLFRCRRERVFNAFTGADKLTQWFSPSKDVAVQILALQFEPDGEFRIRYDLPGESLCLRSGIDGNEIVDQLSGITSEPVWDNGVLIRSAEDGLAHVLKRHLDGIAPQMLGNTSGGEQLGLFVPEKPEESRASSTQLGGSSCPKCYGRVVHQEGCIRCLECGYTKCE